MSRKNKTKNSIIKLIVLLVIILIILVIILKKMSSPEPVISNNSNESINVVISAEEVKEKKDTEELAKLKKMGERNRIEYYITKFINYAENGEYETAYDLLNKEYRDNYFPTESSFKEYVEQNFTKMLDIEYTNFERNGEIYVSWVKLTDAINGTKDSGKEFNFVVKENDFNDFELSFSKK